MFVVIRSYPAGAARADEVARRVGEGLVPVLEALPGFRAYYAFVAEDGRPVSVSMTAGRDAAVVANERARAWVAANMADLIPGPPEVMMGEMLVDAATFGRSAAQEEAAPRETRAPEVPHDALD
jgi:hypothetical protein